MQRARAAIALLAVLAIDAPADKLLGTMGTDGATTQRPDVRSILPCAPRHQAFAHVSVSFTR